MHELSIAQSLVELAIEAAADAGIKSVKAVHLKLGILSGVVKESLEFSFDIVTEGTPLEGARLVIEEVPVKVFCPDCKEAHVLPEPFPMRCPVCGAKTGQVLEGREIELYALEGGVGMQEATSNPRIVEIRQNVLKKNDLLARGLRKRFLDAGVYVINVVSSPGAGKTTLLTEVLARLGKRYRVAALVGDLATENDAERLRKSGAQVRQITTGTVCHLEAEMVERNLEGWDMRDIDFLFIENVGNLVCPASYDLGENERVVLFSVTEGEDKPVKYPTIVNSADLAVVTKVDLAEAVGFQRERFYEALNEVRPGIPVLEVSARSGEGIDEWVSHLERAKRSLKGMVSTS